MTTSAGYARAIAPLYEAAEAEANAKGEYDYRKTVKMLTRRQYVRTSLALSGDYPSSTRPSRALPSLFAQAKHSSKLKALANLSQLQDVKLQIERALSRRGPMALPDIIASLSADPNGIRAALKELSQERRIHKVKYESLFGDWYDVRGVRKYFIA